MRLPWTTNKPNAKKRAAGRASTVLHERARLEVRGDGALDHDRASIGAAIALEDARFESDVASPSHTDRAPDTASLIVTKRASDERTIVQDLNRATGVIRYCCTVGPLSPICSKPGILSLGLTIEIADFGIQKTGWIYNPCQLSREQCCIEIRR